MRARWLLSLPFLLLAGCASRPADDPGIVVEPLAPLATTGTDAVPGTAGAVVAHDETVRIDYAHGEIRRVTTSAGCVALTFDDGPHATLTPRLLDILAEMDAHATFFVVGNRVVQWPDVVARAVAEGHEIANHSWNHADMRQLGDAAILTQFNDTDAAIEAAAGIRPAFARLPYDGTSPHIVGLLDRPIVMWDVDPRDWDSPQSTGIIAAVLRQARSGSIVLLHDIQPQTINAMRGIITGLRAEGLEPVTLTEMLTNPAACQPPTPVLVAAVAEPAA